LEKGLEGIKKDCSLTVKATKESFDEVVMKINILKKELEAIGDQFSALNSKA
jgi:hypothetical protein